MDPDEAFASLPTLGSHENGDPLEATARLAEKDAGLAFTLAWNLAYKNDETFGRMTPEERYTAFLAWIDGELAGPGGTPLCPARYPSAVPRRASTVISTRVTVASRSRALRASRRSRSNVTGGSPRRPCPFRPGSLSR